MERDSSKALIAGGLGHFYSKNKGKKIHFELFVMYPSHSVMLRFNVKLKQRLILNDDTNGQS